MITDEAVSKLGRALNATGALIAAVSPQQWENPSPCSQWTVRGLVDRMSAGNFAFAAILSGREPDLLRASDAESSGQMYVWASNELFSAAQSLTQVDRMYDTPFGPATGATLLHLRTTEILVHGWDIAEATGQPAALPNDLAEEELAFARTQFPAQVPRSRFGPEHPDAGGESPICRLAAYLGRPMLAVR